MARALIPAPEGHSLQQALSVSGTQSRRQDVPHVSVVPPWGLPGLIPYWVQGPSFLPLVPTLTPDRTWALLPPPPASRPLPRACQLETLLLTPDLLAL